MMSIRLKLLLSYAAMLVIPIVLILLISVLLVVVYHGDVQKIRDVYGTKANRFDDHKIERLMKEIKRTAEGNPSLFSDTPYLDDISQELAGNGSGLVVSKDDRFIYISESLNQPDLIQQLPSIEHAEDKEQEPSIMVDSELYLVDQFDFMFADNHPGSVLVVNKVNPIVNFARKFFPVLFISMLIILVLTHTVLTYVVSKSIISPLGLLKKAVKRIKAGDLDFHVQVSGKDEIGQLGFAFEEMRHQLQESIQTQLQYEENRKELISSISHDLRTPLTAIKGYVDGIQDGVADTPEKMEKYIRIISSKAEEMERLIEELFLYSKLDLKRLPFHFELVPIHAFLQDWAEELHFELEKKGFRFDLDIQLNPTTQVSMDRDKLKRVLSNIIDNCVKYMDKEEKVIGLRVYETSNSVIVEFSDNGQGIDPDALPHIFERFYRAEQSRNTLTGGSGLGLAIAKQIMEGHGGTIQVQSLKGEGTSIAVSLPIKNR